MMTNHESRRRVAPWRKIEVAQAHLRNGAGRQEEEKLSSLEIIAVLTTVRPGQSQTKLARKNREKDQNHLALLIQMAHEQREQAKLTREKILALQKKLKSQQEKLRREILVPQRIESNQREKARRYLTAIRQNHERENDMLRRTTQKILKIPAQETRKELDLQVMTRAKNEGRRLSHLTLQLHLFVERRRRVVTHQHLPNAGKESRVLTLQTLIESKKGNQRNANSAITRQVMSVLNESKGRPKMIVHLMIANL